MSQLAAHTAAMSTFYGVNQTQTTGAKEEERIGGQTVFRYSSMIVGLLSLFTIIALNVTNIIYMTESGGTMESIKNTQQSLSGSMKETTGILIEDLKPKTDLINSMVSFNIPSQLSMIYSSIKNEVLRQCTPSFMFNNTICPIAENPTHSSYFEEVNLVGISSCSGPGNKLTINSTITFMEFPSFIPGSTKPGSCVKLPSFSLSDTIFSYSHTIMGHGCSEVDVGDHYFSIGRISDTGLDKPIFETITEWFITDKLNRRSCTVAAGDFGAWMGCVIMTEPFLDDLDSTDTGKISISYLDVYGRKREWLYSKSEIQSDHNYASWYFSVGSGVVISDTVYFLMWGSLTFSLNENGFCRATGCQRFTQAECNNAQRPVMFNHHQMVNAILSFKVNIEGKPVLYLRTISPGLVPLGSEGRLMYFKNINRTYIYIRSTGWYAYPLIGVIKFTTPIQIQWTWQTATSRPGIAPCGASSRCPYPCVTGVYTDLFPLGESFEYSMTVYLNSENSRVNPTLAFSSTSSIVYQQTLLSAAQKADYTTTTCFLFKLRLWCLSIVELSPSTITNSEPVPFLYHVDIGCHSSQDDKLAPINLGSRIMLLGPINDGRKECYFEQIGNEYYFIVSIPGSIQAYAIRDLQPDRVPHVGVYINDICPLILHTYSGLSATARMMTTLTIGNWQFRPVNRPGGLRVSLPKRQSNTTMGKYYSPEDPGNNYYDGLDQVSLDVHDENVSIILEFCIRLTRLTGAHKMQEMQCHFMHAFGNTTTTGSTITDDLNVTAADRFGPTINPPKEATVQRLWGSTKRDSPSPTTSISEPISTVNYLDQKNTTKQTEQSDNKQKTSAPTRSTEGQADQNGPQNQRPTPTGQVDLNHIQHHIFTQPSTSDSLRPTHQTKQITQSSTFSPSAHKDLAPATPTPIIKKSTTNNTTVRPQESRKPGSTTQTPPRTQGHTNPDPTNATYTDTPDQVPTTTDTRLTPVPAANSTKEKTSNPNKRTPEPSLTPYNNETSQATDNNNNKTAITSRPGNKETTTHIGHTFKTSAGTQTPPLEERPPRSENNTIHNHPRHTSTSKAKPVLQTPTPTYTLLQPRPKAPKVEEQAIQTTANKINTSTSSTTTKPETTTPKIITSKKEDNPSAHSNHTKTPSPAPTEQNQATDASTHSSSKAASTSTTKNITLIESNAENKNSTISTTRTPTAQQDYDNVESKSLHESRKETELHEATANLRSANLLNSLNDVELSTKSYLVVSVNSRGDTFAKDGRIIDMSLLNDNPSSYSDDQHKSSSIMVSSLMQIKDVEVSQDDGCFEPQVFCTNASYSTDDFDLNCTGREEEMICKIKLSLKKDMDYQCPGGYQDHTLVSMLGNIQSSYGLCEKGESIKPGYSYICQSGGTFKLAMRKYPCSQPTQTVNITDVSTIMLSRPECQLTVFDSLPGKYPFTRDELYTWARGYTYAMKGVNCGIGELCGYAFIIYYSRDNIYIMEPNIIYKRDKPKTGNHVIVRNLCSKIHNVLKKGNQTECFTLTVPFTDRVVILNQVSERDFPSLQGSTAGCIGGKFKRLHIYEFVKKQEAITSNVNPGKDVAKNIGVPTNSPDIKSRTKRSDEVITSYQTSGDTFSDLILSALESLWFK
ncbi:cell attachment protein [Denotus virus]|nr:cell attachment protein [Denotus virus]